MTGVILGLPGDYLTEGSGSHYVTKVGGLPDLPANGGRCIASGITCNTCGGLMSLVLQAYAPLGQKECQDLPERTLYVFGCLSEACTQTPPSWRAFRCQLPTRQTDPPQEDANQNGKENSLTTAPPPVASALNGGDNTITAEPADGASSGKEITLSADSADCAFDFSGLQAAFDNVLQQSNQAAKSAKSGTAAKGRAAKKKNPKSATIADIDCFRASENAAFEHAGQSTKTGHAKNQSKLIGASGPEEGECASGVLVGGPGEEGQGSGSTGGTVEGRGSGSTGGTVGKSSGSTGGIVEEGKCARRVLVNGPGKEGQGSGGTSGTLQEGGCASCVLLNGAGREGQGSGGTSGTVEEGPCGSCQWEGGNALRLPEFALYAEIERSIPARKSTAGREQEHIRQLIAAYEAEDGGKASRIYHHSQIIPCSCCQYICKMLKIWKWEQYHRQDVEDVEGAAVSWAGEQYEEDRVRLVPPAFFRFTKRLQLCPQQAARYGFRSDLLWPSDSLPKVEPCSLCGAPRCLELQLMAPLMAHINEAASWSASGVPQGSPGAASWSASGALQGSPGAASWSASGALQGSPGAASWSASGAQQGSPGAASWSASGVLQGSAGPVGVPPTWDWLTIAVFTCSSSCSSGDDFTWVEEQVAVCNEDA